MEHNFDAGDEIIDVVGFSRGATLAISFANEIAGKYANRAVRFIGVWDIVGFEVPAEGKVFRNWDLALFLPFGLGPIGCVLRSRFDPNDSRCLRN
jgi:hypothetical protein